MNFVLNSTKIMSRLQIVFLLLTNYSGLKMYGFYFNFIENLWAAILSDECFGFDLLRRSNSKCSSQSLISYHY